MLVSWDLEVMEWDENVPPEQLPISCAMAAWRGPSGIVFKEWRAETGKAMTDHEVQLMSHDLWKSFIKNNEVVTVNGAGFDFRVLGGQSGLMDLAAEMTLRHIDLCFIILAKRGHWLGLDAMSKGAGVEGKLHNVTLKDGSVLDDMDGSKAPELWKAGEDEAVLEYLREDVRSTLEAAEVIKRRGSIKWTARSGRANAVDFGPPGDPLPTVQNCMRWGIPNNSWMDDPPTRESVVGWALRPQMNTDNPKGQIGLPFVG